MRLRKILGGASACAILALAANVSLADDSKAVDETESVLSDMKVARDKDTGKFRAPTAEENAELAAKSRTMAPSVVVVSRPTSSVEVRADGSAVGKRSLEDMDDLVLTKTEDGEDLLQHSSSSETDTDAANDASSQILPKE